MTTEDLIIQSIYPDHEDYNFFIMHTNKGTFYLHRDDAQKIKDALDN